MSAQNAIAFAGRDLIARGCLKEVASAVKSLLDGRDPRPVLIFDATTSRPIEIDFRGTLEDVLARLPHPAPTPDCANDEAEPTAPRGPGRPKLGVVAREVTLLPRHWEWLASQPGGASVTLRKLVEHARRENAEADRIREARDATYRFMLAMAGDEAGFEEATRALYADDEERFDSLVEGWPDDVGSHARRLASKAFSADRAC